MTIIFSAREVSVRYGRREALAAVDVEGRQGVTALLGPNGAGKTTLLHLLCGLRRPSAGSLSVLGIDMTRRTARREAANQVGFLPQSFGFLPGFTAREFVAYAAWLKRVPSRGAQKAVSAALSDVGMTERADSKLRTLSGGMLRRVGIATALVHRPPMLILDEPSVGLDPEQRVELTRLLVRLGEQTSVVLSTHLLEDVRATCNNVIVLNEGRVKHAGTLSNLETAGLGSLENGYLMSLSDTHGASG